jgi:hypothetical protein
LQVLRQTFFLPFGVKTAAVTATSQGITSKMVLMGTFSDQVCLVPDPSFRHGDDPCEGAARTPALWPTLHYITLHYCMFMWASISSTKWPCILLIQFGLCGNLVQVYMMDKRFLDPRRPLGTPTAEDKAEMLIPYEAELPATPMFFITHNRQVANLRGGPSVTFTHAPCFHLHQAVQCMGALYSSQRAQHARAGCGCGHDCQCARLMFIHLSGPQLAS